MEKNDDEDRGPAEDIDSVVSAGHTDILGEILVNSKSYPFFVYLCNTNSEYIIYYELMSQAEGSLNSLYRSVSESFSKTTIVADVFERSGYVYKVYKFGDPSQGSLLLTSGVHGDERNISVLPCLIHAAQSQNSLPHITYIDFANPSSLRTIDGQDLNRGFDPNRPMHVAAHGLVKCIKDAQGELGMPFGLGIDFHGDYGSLVGDKNTMSNRHYIYDPNPNSLPLAVCRKRLRQIGILPFEGQDDFDVTGLGTVVDGYIPNAVPDKFDGSLQCYMKNIGHVRTSWTAEVPVHSPELPNSQGLRQPIKTQTAITYHVLQAGIETVRASRK